MMIKVIQGVDISTYRDQIKLNMIHGLKYTPNQLRDMSTQDMLNQLIKNNKAKLVNKKDKVLDPFNKQQHINKQVNKVADTSMNAKMRHTEVKSINKDPSYQKANQPDPLKEGNSNYTRRVRENTKVHTTVGKDSVKVKSASSPRLLNTRGIINKFKGASGWTKLTIGIGVTLGMSWFVNSFNRVRPRFTPTYISKDGLDYRSSAYIPEKYSRGYDTIKESTTDFGSRVRLDKVTNKVSLCPANTTRNGFVTNTNSVIKSNLALNAHANAINHTRY